MPLSDYTSRSKEVSYIQHKCTVFPCSTLKTDLFLVDNQTSASGNKAP